jgi:lipopolysaccharide export system permease protein
VTIARGGEVELFGGMLQRSIFWELMRVFLMSLAGITGIFLMGAIVAEATQRGLAPAQILAAIPLILPSTLPFTIPATTLFATCVVYGRLSADNEILAIRSAGVHLARIVGPAVFLGCLTSAVTMGLFYQLIPYTHYLLRSSFMNDAEEYLYAILKKDRCINLPNVPYKIWVQHVQGRRLEDALFKRKAPKGDGYDVIARAKEAELRVDLPNKQVLVHMRGCTLQDENGKNQGYFRNQTWTVPLPQNFGAVADPKPRGMSYPALFIQRDKVRDTLAEKAAEIEELQTHPPANIPAPDLAKLIDSLKYVQRNRWFEFHNVDSELHMRPALALGCLCFVLVGCPVGIWFSRSDYLSAFITCFLPTVFIYYPLLLCGTSYAKQGKYHPALALWVANLLMIAIAIVLFRRLVRR